MAVYQEKDGSWRVIYRYTDWKGERKQTPQARRRHQAGCIGVRTGAAT